MKLQYHIIITIKLTTYRDREIQGKGGWNLYLSERTGDNNFFMPSIKEIARITTQ